MHDGGFVPNEGAISSSSVSNQYIEESVFALKKEIDRRLIKFRGDNKYQLAGNVAILVDNGIATGATMFAAIKWLKTQVCISYPTFF